MGSHQLIGQFGEQERALVYGARVYNNTANILHQFASIIPQTDHNKTKIERKRKTKQKTTDDEMTTRRVRGRFVLWLLLLPPPLFTVVAYFTNCAQQTGAHNRKYLRTIESRLGVPYLFNNEQSVIFFFIGFGCFMISRRLPLTFDSNFNK